MTKIYQQLFDYGDWANAKVFALCEGLSNGQLDATRAMGFGSLRNTLFHILEAEQLWLERWLGQPWRPLQPDADGLSVQDIAAAASKVSKSRNELLKQETPSDFSRVVEFSDSRQQQSRIPLGYLLHHVANHGIHHRAQALNYLRSFDRTVAAGLDFLFWKLAYPSCPIPPESIEALTAYGLEIGSGESESPDFDRVRLQDYFAYNDWAMGVILDAAQKVPDSELDRDFAMGPGTLRKSIQHMIDAERWWLANWETDQSPFPRGEAPRSLAEMQSLFSDTARSRDAFLSTLDEESARRVVRVTAGGPVSCFRVTESLLQLCGHGTHHRAQCLNMLRQLGVELGWIDFIVWVRENR